MYDYRRMTPEERRAIVEARRSRGFPLHRPPHLAQGPSWYFITAATYEHRLHFSTSPELCALERRLLEAFQTARIPCAGWVVLPNHYHALIEASDLGMVGIVLGRVHGRSARYANQRDGTPGRRVWFRFSDRRVRSSRHFQACLHYLVINPIKHGLVSAIDDWPWSCVHDLISSMGRNALMDSLRRYPIDDFGKGWDDFGSG
jgi:putative transposase